MGFKSYQSNAEFYKDGGPIFLYINDGAGVRWITSGLVYDIARELNGGLVTASTRYFGQNTFMYGKHFLIENLNNFIVRNDKHF